jgi:hypothetical protein
MKSPTALVLLWFALFAFCPIHSAANTYLNSDKIEILIEGQSLLFNDHFDAVDSLYDVYISDYPGDPAGYLFKAAALMGEMADREENLYPDTFKTLLDSVETLIAQQLDSCSSETGAWMYLYSGHARAYRSLWESRFGSFISAVKNGFAARSEYDKGFKADSTLYDLYLGLGSYHYWKSAKGGLLRFFRILKNERDKGLRELHLAADSSLLSQELARSALIWVLLDKKEYDSVISIASDFVSKYPDGKSFLWPLATACYKDKNYKRALATYQKLRERLETTPGNLYNLIECDYYLCKCLEKLGRKNDARRQAQKSEEYHDSISKDIRKRQRKNIAYIRRLAHR